MDGKFEANFDDSALKSAICGVWGSERAPQQLRSRIAMLASEGRPPAVYSYRIRWRPMAAAAVLIIGLGTMVFQLVKLRPVRLDPPPRYALAPTLQQELVARHDTRASTTDRRGGAKSTDNFAQMAAELKDKLHLTVMAAPIGDDYKFDGATLITLENNIPAAQLLFRRGSETISVFSMRASAVTERKQGARFVGRDEAHNLRGVVQDGAFYCVVGSSPDLEDCGGHIGRALYALQTAFPPTSMYAMTAPR